MRVGVNYPWRDYGWDFGTAPPAWRREGATPRWADDIDRHLRHFAGLGIDVVRWFVLGDGLTYGSGSLAPRKRSSGARGWRFDPPPLDAGFLAHYEQLLGRFDASVANGAPRVQLLPVLIDFHFCGAGITPVARPDPRRGFAPVSDPGWVKQGRADAIIEGHARATFLDRVLDPLLAVSGRHASAIYAWELINEPEWITAGWHPGHLARPPVPEASMRAFIGEGADRIRRAGFKATTGFASARGLRTSGIFCDVNQFHHYPAGRSTLDPHVFDPAFPGIIGEFATAPADVWPELVPAGQTVLDRLKLIAARGYALALPWSFRSQDRHAAWSPAVEHDVQLFTGAGGHPAAAP